MNVQGRWEGKLLDISGPAALIVLNLRDRGGELSGDFSVSFLSPAEDGCGDTPQRLAQVGPVTGKSDKETDRVVLNYEMTIDLQPVSVTFEGRARRADPHALRAVIGLYDVRKGGEKLTLEGGACVLWLYADPANVGRKNG